LLVRWQHGTYVLTAAHVVDGTELFAMALPRVPGQRDTEPVAPASLEAVYADRGTDVAVLRIADARAVREVARRAVPLRAKMPALGVPVWVFGYPLDPTQDTATVSRGLYSGVGSFPRFGKNVPLARITGASIRSGSSGGPVMSADGALVGLIAGTSVDEGVRAEGQAQASTADEIIAGLKAAALAHPKAEPCPVCARVSQALVLSDGYRDARDEAQAAFWDDLASRALGEWESAPVKDAPALVSLRCGRRGPALDRFWCGNLLEDVRALRRRNAWVPPIPSIGACERTGYPVAGGASRSLLKPDPTPAATAEPMRW
jgi:hypothetical protein